MIEKVPNKKKVFANRAATHTARLVRPNNGTKDGQKTPTDRSCRDFIVNVKETDESSISRFEAIVLLM